MPAPAAGTQPFVGFRKSVRAIADMICSIQDEAERREADAVVIALGMVRDLAAEQGVVLPGAQLVTVYEQATGQQAGANFAQLHNHAKGRHYYRRSVDPRQMIEQGIKAMERTS